MLKGPGVLLTAALLLACIPCKADAAEPVPGTEAASSITKPVPPADKKNTAAEQDAQHAVGLALKTINLSQGEGGIELWRLKAEWANMQQEDGKILVQRPTLTYFISEKDKPPLLVTSGSGIIDQKEQLLKFIDEVRISQANKSIRGDLLVYNGTVKTMTLPQGGEFSDTGVFGNASFLVWDMNRKTIRAEGGVSVRFAAPETPAPLTPEQEH